MTDTLDKPARQKLAQEIRRFLAGEQSAFAFHEAIFTIHDATRDQTVHTIVEQLWCFYDDCEDHYVALTKPGWDYIQRLLLVLEADRTLAHSTTRYWHWTQLVAFAALLGFAACVWCFGIGEQLLVFAMPFGLISMAISSWRDRSKSRTGRKRAILTPFASFTEMRAAYQSSPNFRKEKYRAELRSVRIRSRVGELAGWLPTIAAWLMLAPIPLLFQCLPCRDTVVRTI